MAPHRPHFGFILEASFTKNLNFEWTKGLQKMDQKKGARPYAKSLLWPSMTMARGSLTAPLACALFWTRNNYLSKKQEQLLISESISEPFSWNGLFFDFMSEEFFIFWWNLKQKRQVIADVFSYGSFPKACDLTRSGPRPGEFNLLLQIIKLFAKWIPT